MTVKKAATPSTHPSSWLKTHNPKTAVQNSTRQSTPVPANRTKQQMKPSCIARTESVLRSENGKKTDPTASGSMLRIRFLPVREAAPHRRTPWFCGSSRRAARLTAPGFYKGLRLGGCRIYGFQKNFGGALGAAEAFWGFGGSRAPRLSGFTCSRKGLYTFLGFLMVVSIYSSLYNSGYR